MKITRKKAFTMPMRPTPETPPGVVFPPAMGREDDRLAFDNRDLLEPDDLEDWLGEQLHDWKLLVSAETLDHLQKVLGQLLNQTREARARVKNDLRQEGYLEGQINILETVSNQVQRASDARMKRIGERVPK